MFEILLHIDTNLLIWARSLIDPKYAYLIQWAWESIVIFVAFFLLWLWLTGVWKKDNRYRMWALEIFTIIVLTFVIHAMINFWLPQWRVSPQQVVQGIAPLIPHPIDNSFPSGHALFSAAFLVGLWHSYRRYFWIATALFFSIITAFARVTGGVHYPWDILWGWIFGALWAFLATLVIRTSLFRLHIFPSIIRLMSIFRL